MRNEKIDKNYVVANEYGKNVVSRLKTTLDNGKCRPTKNENTVYGTPLYES